MASKPIMSVQLNSSNQFLKPPPNLEFVHGFPGIPPDPGRPLASVQGGSAPGISGVFRWSSQTVELRSGDDSVKARWVKIELRKVETLPGGGRSNTYIDVVGESPITLWQAKNEWDEIQSQDLSFQIRVPESIPPSLTLERSAGIKYELVASILTKGKKGFLGREATPLTVTASCQIVIDKHELHSAWPLYTLPERKSKMLDGYTLTVDQTLHAYGPGDRITVQSLIKNNTIQTNQVRYYELSLREHVVYKPAQNQNRIRKMVAQVQTRSRAIVLQRIPATKPSVLHFGMQAEEELSVHIPFSQTTKTVSFANRIEVQFKIHVRVVLATGLQLFLDFPITMSNWTRAQSIDLVRQIGPTGMLGNPGGIGRPVTASPDGFGQYSAMASTPQGTPQSQIGWPSSGDFNQGYFNSEYWATTAAPPFNGITLRSSGSFADGLATGAAERSSTTETMFHPHQLLSVYGNDFHAMPGGSAHPSMTSPTASNRFISQLSFQSISPFIGDSSLVWPSERPSSSAQPPAYGSPASNASYQNATASMRQGNLLPVPAKGGPVYYQSAAEEDLRPNDKQATELEIRTQVDVYGNESAPVPYEALYPSGPSEPSAPPVALNLSLNITRSRSPDQGRDADVDKSSTAPLPHPLHRKSKSHLSADTDDSASISMAPAQKTNLRFGENKGHAVHPLERKHRPSRRKGDAQKGGRPFVKSIIREVTGFAPYERRIMELLRNNKDKKAKKLTKKRLGTITRAKKKLDELGTILAESRRAH
ncbi:hypothetical protein FS837_002146 [Tulasnella sp. UAMH 9824]|nr:hypothetical protein FS837_002146 [Tulasnella sp. UAMH 9824]